VAHMRVDQFKPCSGEGFDRQNAPAEVVGQVTAAPVARARGDLVSRRSTVLARLVAIVCTFGACSRAAQPLRVVERLVDHPIVAGAGDAAVLAAHVPNRWTAAEIEERWVHVAGRRAMTFRSPRLDVGTVDDLDAIVVVLPAGTSRAILLWHDQPTLTRADYTRNRRDLEPRAAGPTTVLVRAKELRSDVASAVRYLFLHFPDATRVDAAVTSIAVVRTVDVLGASASGRMRRTVNGEVRDLFYASSGPIEWPLDVPVHAELQVGFLAAAATNRARITFASSGRTSTLFEQMLEGGGWQELRVPLHSGRGVLRLESDGNTLDAPNLWSNPLVAEPWAEAPPPNVVLYVVDALRADRLGLYGSKRNASPFLDDLGRRSLVFERAYTAASWTKPSVATLLTGLFPQTHRLGAHYYTDPLPDDAPTLQSDLRARGYATAQFSANAFSGTLSNLDRGFDLTMAPDAFRETSVGSGKVSAATLNGRILPWIDAHANQSFFVYIQSVEPHEPRTPTLPGADPLDAYDAEVAVNDREIGRLYQHLARLGLASRTIFVVTSDHGEALGEHGQWGHGLSAYEEEIRVPLIIHWPGRVQPSVVGEAVSLVDIVPTVLELCRVPFDPARTQGRSLVPGSRAGQSSRPILSARFVYPEDLDVEGADRVESLALIDGPWKLMAVGNSNAPRYELYELVRDPRERDDRSSAEPERVRRLARVLTQVLREQAGARARFVEAHGQAAVARGHAAARDVIDQLKSLGYMR
jgi:arylsulfatase A-like enzyme